MIVETGTGLNNADSYVSLAEANAYATARAWAGWTGTDAAKEAALVTATSYIDTNYRFKGSLLTLTQSLAWPRVDVTDIEGRPLTGVPVNVKSATIELAMRALIAPLVASPETAAVKRKRVKAGSVETETEYAISVGSSSDPSPSPMADRLLAGLLAGGNVSSLGGGFVSFVPG
jgi:hypothetical protein